MCNAYHNRFQVSDQPFTDQNLNAVWFPPPSDSIKVNSDAAISEAGDLIGVGIVARDSQGQVIFSAGKILSNCLDVQLAEASALRYGLELAGHFSIQNVICETDSQLTIQNLWSSLHDLIGEYILQAAKSFNMLAFLLLKDLVTMWPIR